jgi:molybdate transport system substrate-binding protein
MFRRHIRVLAGAGAASLVVALAACSSSSSSTAPAAVASSAKPTGTLVMFAATSLTDAFNKIADQFESVALMVKVYTPALVGWPLLGCVV